MWPGKAGKAKWSQAFFQVLGVWIIFTWQSFESTEVHSGVCYPGGLQSAPPPEGAAPFGSGGACAPR